MIRREAFLRAHKGLIRVRVRYQGGPLVTVYLGPSLTEAVRLATTWEPQRTLPGLESGMASITQSTVSAPSDSASSTCVATSCTRESPSASEAPSLSERTPLPAPSSPSAIESRKCFGPAIPVSVADDLAVDELRDDRTERRNRPWPLLPKPSLFRRP